MSLNGYLISLLTKAKLDAVFCRSFSSRTHQQQFVRTVATCNAKTPQQHVRRQPTVQIQLSLPKSIAGTSAQPADVTPEIASWVPNSRSDHSVQGRITTIGSAMLRSLQYAVRVNGRRTLATEPFLGRYTDRRVAEEGAGGRSSVAGVKVAIFGATGVLGKHFCHQLGKNGAFVYVGNRGDEAEHRDIKPMFDLGHTRFVYYSPRDVDSMKEVIADADIVVNLISKHNETGQPIQTSTFPYVGWQTNFTFEDMNVGIARKIAELCVEMQVDHLIHVSAAGVSPDHPSEWARTKYAGEKAVKEVFPWATIVRPTQMFGTEDKFLHFYANMAKFHRFIPLIDDGSALTQPVWVVDVAKTINRITDDPRKFEGRTVDCFGPSDYTHEELAKFVLDLTEQNRPILYLPKAAYLAWAKVMGYQQFIPMNQDIAELWSQDFLPAMTAEEYKAQPDDASRILTMEDLGITATPIEKEAFMYLHRFREGGHFGRVQGYHNDAAQNN